jgi:hypothetical protein
MALTEGATAGDGDAGKVGRAGGTDVGDIGSRFIEGADEGILAGSSSLGGTATGGGVSGSVGSAGGPDMGGARVACSMDDGGVAASSVARLDRDSGERVSSSMSLWSRSSSSSFRRRLGFLAGGGSVSGEGGGDVAGGGVEIAGGGKSAAGTAATAAIIAEDGDDDGADSSHAAVAACSRLRQRRRWRLSAALSVTAGAGMLHQTV